MVFADIGLVERVFQNLLDNAVKHSPEGGTINIYLDNDVEGIRIRVTDSGPGIPEELQPHIPAGILYIR